MAVASHGSVLDLNGRSFPAGHSAALIRISDRSQPRPQPQIQGELGNHAIFEVAKQKQKEGMDDLKERPLHFFVAVPSTRSR
ncbi:unnamed protein product [Urochloa humidicola]